MTLNFKKFAAEGDKFLKYFSKELSYPEDRNRTARVLRSLLHTLRDMITPEENVELLPQLPMFMKAVYVEGWTLKSAQPARIRTMDQFIKAVRMKAGRTANTDFESDDQVETAMSVLFMTLRRYVSLGEMEDIKAVLPKQLKPMLDQVLMF